MIVQGRRQGAEGQQPAVIRRYSTARVSRRLIMESTACLRARRCIDQNC